MEPEVVLVTGCSTGIGRAIATTLTKAGYAVVATARRPETLDGINAAMTLELDVTDQASIEAAVRAILDRFGRIDVLVNNAGYAIRGAVEEVDVAAVTDMFNVNVNGVIRMVQAVAPGMRAHGSGRILTIGSDSGKLSSPANGTYSATKHALEALSDSLRWELGPFGIEVVLIEPGNIGTPFNGTALRGSGHLLDRRDSPYAALYTRFKAVTADSRAHEPGPDVVARVVLAALRARRPRARYYPAVPIATRIVLALPDQVGDLVMRRLFAIGSRRRSRSVEP